MLARPMMMRCLLDVLTFVTHDKKEGVVCYESSYTHRGRVSIGDFCDRGSVYEGCREDFLYLFFSFSFSYIISCTLVL